MKARPRWAYRPTDAASEPATGMPVTTSRPAASSSANTLYENTLAGDIEAEAAARGSTIHVETTHGEKTIGGGRETDEITANGELPSLKDTLIPDARATNTF